MNINQLLDDLVEYLENTPNMPFSEKCIIDKIELLELISEIKDNIPEEIDKAKWVVNERERILNEAKKEAKEIINNSEQKLLKLIDEHEITVKAREKSERIIKNAQKKSKEINYGTMNYADKMLAEVEKTLSENLKIIRANRKELKD